MTGSIDEFRNAFERFVQDAAQGNKALAARLLNVTRAEVHAYLGQRIPRPDKRRRIERKMSDAGGRQVTSEAIAHDQSDREVREEAYQMIRYLYLLLEAERTRMRPSSRDETDLYE